MVVLRSQFADALALIEPSADDKTNAPKVHQAVRDALASAPTLKDWGLTPGRLPGKRHFEAGCGDPVSLTPSFAVMEAASLAVRLAVALLTGRPMPAPEIERDYR